MKSIFTLLRLIVAVIVILFGLVNLPEFSRLVHLDMFSHQIDRFAKILWATSEVLFLLALLLVVLKKEQWWMPSALAILFSQYAIFSTWNETRYETILNIVFACATTVGFCKWRFKSSYKKEVAEHLKKQPQSHDLLTEEDIRLLPDVIKKYLRYAGVIGKPKVRNFKVVFKGRLRKNSQSEWMPFTSEQYNFMYPATRLFFMNAVMKHLPVAGFHCFNNAKAFMDIRLLSLFKVQYQSGKEMDIAETVTFFNDMCCMAPATLIDRRIEWKNEKKDSVTASFTDNNISISATLYFNDRGALIDFVSEDRYAASEGKTMTQIPWSTPLRDFKDINGVTLPGAAETIYMYPDGSFTYGEFQVVNVEYNCNS